MNLCIVLFQGSVRFRVTVPSMPDKPEFTLKGQTLNFSLPLTDNVSLFHFFKFMLFGKIVVWSTGVRKPGNI